MKRSELFFSAVQVIVDYAMIVAAGVFAFLIRDIPQVLALKPKLYNYSFEDFIKIVLLVALLFIIIMALEGPYKIRATRRFWQEARLVFVATGVALVIIIVAIFLQRTWFSSRFIILSGWVMAVALILLGRFFLRELQRYLLVKKGIGVHRLLLIGRNGQINLIKHYFQQHPRAGYKIIGHIQNAYVKEIKTIKQQRGIDDIIVCEPSIPDSDLEKLIDFSHINNISFKFIPTTLQTSRYRWGTLEGEPIIEVPNTPVDGWGKIVKRIFDIIGSVLVIIVTSPIMALTTLAIKLDSRGPVIYKNERVGSEGNKFFVYKFRYMKWEYSVSRDNPNFKKAIAYEKQLIKERSIRNGVLYKIKNDPRKTRVGKFLERYSIDELPQLFNVLKGEMSMVGPRPHQEREVEKYREYHRRLLTIKPGITGMAQVSGRSDLDFEDEYKMDLFYIENWSLWLDIVILFKTFGVLFGKRKNV